LPHNSPPSWPLLYGAVALTTLGTLLLELSLTRIFSVVFYYHFAFLAISIALFGLGAGGVFSYVVSGWRGNLYRKLGLLSLLNCLLVLFAISVVLGQKTTIGNGALALIYFADALPFLCTGIIVSLAISETIERVNRVYFFDLMGAAAGCLLLIPFLDWFGGPDTTLTVAVLFAAAAAIWFTLGASTRGRLSSVAVGLAFAALMGVNFRYHILDVHYAKGHKLEGEQFVKWNSFSRIALAPERESHVPMIFIDADASTGIANFDFDHLTPDNLRDLLHQGPGLPYDLRPGAKTLIIGPGGGWDVARALAAGSHDVTGVEINPIIATTIMRKKFPDLSRGIYMRPDVHIVVEDGRSYVRRSDQKFQVMQATLVDTWASTAAGAFALSENNLYTSDAFRDYLNHLTDDGLLAIQRWGFNPPRESLRLISLAMVALRAVGETDPAQHVIVAREGGQRELSGFGAKDTVIISRKPFSAADVERAKQAIAEGHMTAVYLPGAGIANAFNELLTTSDPARFEKNYPFNITPVSDNQPFFFYTVQPRDLLAFFTGASHDTADYKVNVAVPMLFESLLVSIVAVIVILTLPPLVLGTRLPHEKNVLMFLLYFLFIGAGYILIEVALIQKFVLFLGHPIYALTVVIFSLLVSSGLGSYFSRQWIRGEDGRLLKVLLGVVVLVSLLAVAVSYVLEAGVGWPLPAKILITIALIFPAGFAMGMPFPTGLERLERWHAPSTRWAWSLNAAASVLGSVGALVCAIYLGLVQTLLVGGCLYLGALLVLANDKQRRPVA
jgi:spermidine synthase